MEPHNKDFREDALQRSVDLCADILASRDNAPAWLTVHFLCGFEGNGLQGFLRRSAVRARGGLITTSVSSAKNKFEAARFHRSAMLEHMRAFDRRNTLLSFVGRASKALRASVSFGIELSEDHRLMIEECDPDSARRRFRILISNDIFNILAPAKISCQYMKEVYDFVLNKRQVLPPRINDAREGFLHAKALGFGMIFDDCRENGSLTTLRRLFGGASDHNDEKMLWDFLTPLQSTFVYSRAAGVEAPGGTFDCVRWQYHAPDTHVASPKEPVPPLMSLVFLSDNDGRETYEALERAFGQDLSISGDLVNYLQSNHDHGQRLEAKMLKSYSDHDKSSIRNAISGMASNLVALPGQQVRIKTYVWWMCLLAAELYGRIHEGEPLDYWFIAGDKTEFEDNSRFQLRKLFSDEKRKTESGGQEVESERGSLRIALDGEHGFDEDQFMSVVRRLEKEHFPWFHRGRHALFFDISDEESFCPVGLLEISNNSWQHVLNESFRPAGEQQLEIPASAIVYVDGENGDAGLLCCNPKRSVKSPRVRHVMRYRMPRWRALGVDSRGTELRKLISHAMSIVGDCEDDIAEVVELCMRVSDDLSIGGTLVFVETKEWAESFLELGRSWTFGDSFHDKLPLIAHDGASILYPASEAEDRKWKWVYRRMLTAGNIDRKVQAAVQLWSLDYHKGKPLNGVGTRRWSAALAALKRGVRLVVVISQDGGITCWRASWPKQAEPADRTRTENRGMPVELEYWTMPVGEAPEKPGSCQISEMIESSDG